ncbi:AMP-binding protein [Corynebacterium propinquum]|uniref:AMP-binding protein n=1 Tax=Corynebacterium propinquum TaxID=43769 RepID=UPI001EE7E671|nr:AMP-binding protein [Corynebacterium propinquum]
MHSPSSAHTPNSSADTLAHPAVGSAICHGHSELDRIAQQRIWNDTDQDRDRPDLISLLLQHTQEAPDAPAVVDDQHTLTYAQLVAHATSVAHSLQKQGIDAGQSVGISLPRSAEMVVGIVATLLAGGSFVPLDPSWPQARRESVIHDASLSFVLTQDNFVLTEYALFDLYVTRVLFTPPAMDSGAYVIFTSGSTGRPKFAMIRPGAIV